MITRLPLSYNSPAVAAGRADEHGPVSRRRFATFLPALLVAGLAIGICPATLAELPGPPSEEHVWGGCVLTTDAVAALGKSLAAGEISAPDIDFVLAYSLENDNDGQHFKEGTTGPILCANPETVKIDSTKENTPIPGGTGKVDIKALEQALIMQYQQQDGSRNKRICHTVAGNTDCFLITPVGK